MGFFVLNSHKYNMGLIRTVAPTTTMITLDAAKRQANIEHSFSDDDVQDWLEAAGDAIELETNQCFLPQTWEETFCSWGARLWLSKSPISSLTVQYYDESNDLQTLDADNYQLENYPSPKVWFVPSFNLPLLYPRHDAIVVTMTCGGTIPPAAKLLCRYLVADMNRNRESAIVGTIVGEHPQYRKLVNLLRRGVGA